VCKIILDRSSRIFSIINFLVQISIPVFIATTLEGTPSNLKEIGHCFEKVEDKFENLLRKTYHVKKHDAM
jgi:hypothetical protein